jgi:hypothetical protein
VAGAWGWHPHHLSVPNVMEIWEPKPTGTLWATTGLLRDSFTFTFNPLFLLYQSSSFSAFLFNALFGASTSKLVSVLQRIPQCVSDPLPFPLALPEPVWGGERFLVPAGTVIEPHEILAYSTVSPHGRPKCFCVEPLNCRTTWYKSWYSWFVFERSWVWVLYQTTTIANWSVGVFFTS